MSFWQSNTGKPVTGSAEDSFSGSFKIIPDGTTAPAIIKGFMLIHGDDNQPYYEVQWKLVDGDFKNYEVRQKITCFDSKKVEKADRALNMLMRFYLLLDMKPSHDGAPSDEDLAPMKGKILGIKIQEWSMDGKNGNWVSEIHKADANFMTETGKKLEIVGSPVDSALTRNSRLSAPSDDIPF